MTLLSPRVFEGSWSDARQAAERDQEPILVPCKHYVDDRGWSLMNLLAGAMAPEGQVNFSMQHPGVVKAWHRHDRQSDFWVPVVGDIKVGVHREADGASWMVVLGEKHPGVLVIPPPLWHGAATLGASPAGLLYYVTQTYDPKAPDEHRRPWDSVPGFAWAPECR